MENTPNPNKLNEQHNHLPAPNQASGTPPVVSEDVTTPVQPPSGMSLKKKVIIGIAVFLVLWVGSAVIRLAYYGDPKNNNQGATTEQVSEEQNASGKLLTYNNQELGFTFSYPEEWGDITGDEVVADAVVENSKDSYWAIEGFNKDGGDSLRLAGSSAEWSKSHALDDNLFLDGYKTANFQEIKPKCPEVYDQGKGSCNIVGKDVLLAKFNELPKTGFPVKNWYAVLNLKQNKFNIAAVRLEYIGYQEQGDYPDANISVTDEQFRQVAESFNLL